MFIPEVEKNKPVLKPLNELIMRRVSQLLTDNTVNRHTRENPLPTQIFIDELQSAGKLELGRLATVGRSFGISLTLGVQSIPALHSLYGENDAEAILEMCLYRGYLKSVGKTAEWTEKNIGKALVSVHKTSYTCGSSTGRNDTSGTTETSGVHKSLTAGGGFSFGPSGASVTSSASITRGGSSSVAFAYSQTTTQTTNRSTTTSREERFESVVLASEIQNLPDIQTEQIVAGYFACPHLPVWRAELPLDSVLKAGLPKGDSRLNILERPHEYEGDIPSWNPEDLVRLGITFEQPIKTPVAPFEFDETKPSSTLNE